MPSGHSVVEVRDFATGLDRVDPAWSRLRTEAEAAVAAEPVRAKALIGVLPDRLRTFDRLTGRPVAAALGRIDFESGSGRQCRRPVANALSRP